MTGKSRYNQGWAYGVNKYIYINNRGIKRVLLYYCLVFGVYYKCFGRGDFEPEFRTWGQTPPYLETIPGACIKFRSSNVGEVGRRKC